MYRKPGLGPIYSGGIDQSCMLGSCTSAQCDIFLSETCNDERPQLTAIA